MIEGVGLVADHHGEALPHFPRRLHRLQCGDLIGAQSGIRNVGQSDGRHAPPCLHHQGGQLRAVGLRHPSLQAVRRLVEQNTGQFPGVIAEQFPSEDDRLRVKPGSLQRHLIGPDRMAVHPFEQHRTVWKHRIQRLSPVREFRVVPIVLVPSAAQYPVTGIPFTVFAGAGQNLGLGCRSGQIGVGQSLGETHKVRVGVHETWHHHGPHQVDFTGGGILVEDGPLGPDFHDAATADGHSLGLAACGIHRQDETIVKHEVRRRAAEPATLDQNGPEQDPTDEPNGALTWEHAGKFAQPAHSSLAFWIRGRRKRTVWPSISSTGVAASGAATSSPVAPER